MLYCHVLFECHIYIPCFNYPGTDILEREDATHHVITHSAPSVGGSPGELSEELVTQEKRKKGWRINCDVGETTEGLKNEL